MFQAVFCRVPADDYSGQLPARLHWLRRLRAKVAIRVSFPASRRRRQGYDHKTRAQKMFRRHHTSLAMTFD